MSFQITKKGDFNKQCLQKTAKHRKQAAGQVQIKVAASAGSQNDLAPELKITWRKVCELQPPKRRVRKTEPEHQAEAIRLINAFGFVSPITIRGDIVVDGNVRLAAAKELGMKEIPCIDISHLSEPKARILAISLNRFAEKGIWDFDELKLELTELEIEGLDLTLSAFSPQERDIIFLDDPEMEVAEEAIPDLPTHPVSQAGDLWVLGDRHRLLCGDALEPLSYARLMAGKLGTAVLTDPPYNVKIAGNVSGLGKKKHGEFKMASGEMSDAEFRSFLLRAHKNCADHLMPGGVAYSFMDWRSVDVLISAGREAGLTLINMAVWYKGSGAMGAFLRSAHELVPVFCKGDTPAINNVELGKHGRDRTNVWVYPGANKPGTSAAEALKGHPTPKNVQMCVDAILDVTGKGDVVLDPFLGSGTTLIAAEKSGRVCYGLELDPSYADLCVTRWQSITGQAAIHSETGSTFAELTAERISTATSD